MSDTELRQLGKFRIYRGELQTQSLSKLRQVMSNFIIVRAEVLFDSNTIQYSALSDLFDPVPEGEESPWYDLIINDLIEDDVTVSVTRSTTHGYGT